MLRGRYFMSKEEKPSTEDAKLYDEAPRFPFYILTGNQIQSVGDEKNCCQGSRCKWATFLIVNLIGAGASAGLIYNGTREKGSKTPDDEETYAFFAAGAAMGALTLVSDFFIVRSWNKISQCCCSFFRNDSQRSLGDPLISNVAHGSDTAKITGQKTIVFGHP